MGQANNTKKPEKSYNNKLLATTMQDLLSYGVQRVENIVWCRFRSINKFDHMQNGDLEWKKSDPGSGLEEAYEKVKVQ